MVADFLTLPDELQSLASELLSYLSKRGYRPTKEPASLNLPATPTIVAIRGHETHYFLVRQAVAVEEVDTWFRYACSCARDTRITFCCPENHTVAIAQLNALQRQRIGLTVRTGKGFDTSSEARDLAFHARAPDRSGLKPKIRELLGEAFDRLDAGDWRPAFEDACAVLEEQCRRYLLTKLKMGGVKYKFGKAIKTPTTKQIKKMTLGALKDVFCTMVSQNHIEANLCAALTQLNPDRIRRAHTRTAAGSEAALRRHVGTHMWLITNALAYLV
jgi:hypothetical protein